MAVSKRLRFEILRRDNHACRYCGRSAPEVKLTIDHVVPEALGGSDHPSNLVTACGDCNSGKSSIPPDAPLIEDVTNDAMRWARAMERAAKIDRQKRNDDRRFAAEFFELIAAIIMADPEEQTYCMPDLKSPACEGQEGAVRTIIQFRECGLDLNDLEYAIRRAAANRTIGDQHNWKYFCGICWRMIEQRQERARTLLEIQGDADDG